MLDKQMAKKLNPMVNSPQWEDVQGVPQQPQELGPTGTGGGNIGTGNVPAAGESEFSGTPRAVAGAG
jgi:hypothetical protein